VNEPGGGVPDLLRETATLIRGNFRLVAIAVFVLTAFDVADDLFHVPDRPFGLLGTLALLLFEYELTRAVLRRSGFVTGKRRRGIWAMLGLCLLSDAGILAGILLVVPGIFLAVRWSACVPALISERIGVIEALRRSFEETRGRFWPILAVLLIIYLAPAFLVGTSDAADALAWRLVSNAAANFSIVAGWHAATAIYLTGKAPRGLAEIFS